jgi:glutathione S-transferase
VTLTLWGRPSSVNVQKILWALDEFGLTYDHKIVAGKYGGLDDPAFQALTPVPRVPVLEDGGIGVWESHAILRHLARTHAAHPLGAAMADPAQAAAIDAWLEYGSTSLQPPFIGMFWQLVRMRDDQRDAATLSGHRSAVMAALAVLERGLSDGRTYLAGDSFSLADIGLGSLLYRLFDIAPDIGDATGNVCSWRDRLAAREAYQRHVAVNYDELRVT